MSCDNNCNAVSTKDQTRHGMETPPCSPRKLLLATLAAFAVALALAATASAQQYDPSLYAGMKWRLIGPYRAGRVTTVAGIPGRSAIYYMGTPGGGVWKTTDAGHVWKPIFDDAHVASIGTLALAPSNPNIIYVGTGEQTKGDGVFKSTDAGVTWTNVGLRDTRIITSILVDPQNPDVLLVAALGAFTPGPQRGVFRSKDGGATWIKALFKDEKSGVADMCMDPNDHKVFYAAMWHPNFGPFVPISGSNEGPAAAIYKSTDAGANWKSLPGTGLPSGDLGRIGVTVATGYKGNRVFAIMNQGLFRSDDAGATWRRITTDPRVVGNGYFSKIYSDPRNPDMIYVMQTCTYRSTDGGEHFAALKGAPGGDDYHVLWIDPENPGRMILGVDQGATISVDAGQTWSTWYNQPTGQFYHVITDNAFPYRAYAQQQDSGTVAVLSRSDYGQISFRDWYSVGGFEFGYIAPDPLDPNTVYATNAFSTVTKWDKHTGQLHYVFVPGVKDRASNDPPMAFSPLDPHTLYLGTQHLLKTTDGGESWQAISPDLTEKPKPAFAADNQKKQPPEFAVLSAIAGSFKDPAQIWVGATNGVLQVTRDAGTSWQDVTPANMPAMSGVTMIEASHHDPAVAYAVTASFSDPHPSILRTADLGKTWQKITTGLPDSAQARVVREDPVRPGLLYAGVETGVYVSFDDGGHWQSLQLNLPTTSVRDLTVHGEDLVGATFGRGLWILDDVAPLRQLNAQLAAAQVHLFAPVTAIRLGWDEYNDTPLPPETPTAQNPLNGAILDYYLPSAVSGDVTVAIYDAEAHLVRQYSSVPPPEDKLLKNVPDYWLAPPAVLSKTAGMHRFSWDLRYPDPPVLLYSYYGGPLDYEEYTYTKDAILGGTPRQEPQGVMVVPGTYKAELTVNGQKYEQPLTVELDPREHATPNELLQQFQIARSTEAAMSDTYNAYRDVQVLRAALAERTKSLPAAPQAADKQIATPASAASAALQAADKQIAAFEDGSEEAPGFGPLNRDATRLFNMLETGDERPSQSTRALLEEGCPILEALLTQWRKFNAEIIPPLNAQLAKSNLPSLPTPKTVDLRITCGMH